MYDHQALMRRARRAQPNEVCGFILDDGTIIEIDNVAKDPTASFVMDRGQMLTLWPDSWPHIAAIWHTHPRGVARPSSGDFLTMRVPGMLNPEWDYLIVTQFEVTYWDLRKYAPVEDSHWEQFITTGG